MSRTPLIPAFKLTCPLFLGGQVFLYFIKYFVLGCGVKTLLDAKSTNYQELPRVCSKVQDRDGVDYGVGLGILLNCGNLTSKGLSSAENLTKREETQKKHWSSGGILDRTNFIPCLILIQRQHKKWN